MLSLIPVILWHVLFDLFKWISQVDEKTEIILIIIQSLIMVAYAIYLCMKIPSDEYKKSLL
ncbi:MAG TPA: hypothetical protein DDZ89_15340 [Clostridiales bacterium]|nr:hypothetical protein [Clostridiales bacterium]